MATVLRKPPTGLRQLTITGGVQTDATRLANIQGDGLPFGSGLGVWPAASNLNDNGNATTNITGVTDHSSTTTRATAGTVKFGTTAFNVVSGNAAANEGPSQAINGGLGNTQYTVSAWAWLVSGAATVRAVLFDSVAGKQGSVGVVLTTTPQRISVTATTGVAGINEASYVETTVQQAGTWRIGGWQVETGAFATPYIQTDGADASRAGGRVQLAVQGLFNATQGGVIACVTPSYASGATPTAPRLLDWFTDVSNGMVGAINTSASSYSQTSNAGGSSSSTQSTTFAAGDRVSLLGGWTASQLIAASRGSSLHTAARAGVDVITSATIDLFVNGALTRALYGQGNWLITYKGVASNADSVLANSWGAVPPSLAQIAMLSSGCLPTAFANCKTADVILLPGYFQ